MNELVQCISNKGERNRATTDNRAGNTLEGVKIIEKP